MLELTIIEGELMDQKPDSLRARYANFQKKNPGVIIKSTHVIPTTPDITKAKQYPYMMAVVYQTEMTKCVNCIFCEEPNDQEGTCYFTPGEPKTINIETGKCPEGTRKNQSL